MNKKQLARHRTRAYRKANGRMKRLRLFASSTPFNLDELKKQVKIFTSFGISGE